MHIVKITPEGDKWRVEDRKQRWVQIAYAEDIKCGYQTAISYGNTYPFSAEWHWKDAIANGEHNYFHAEWLGNEWSIFGRCVSLKSPW